MRTTMNIDDDVLLAVEQLAKDKKRGKGAILSDLARQALIGTNGNGADAITEEDGFPILPSRGGIVTNELIDRIRDEEGI